MKSRLWLQRALITLACLGAIGGAVAASASPDPAVDAEEKLDEGLKGFGYLSGLALGCVAQEQRKAMEREVMDLGNEIGRLLGTDRAFLYTASFGYGTSVTIKTEECREVLSRYEARVAKFRQGSGSKP